MSLGRRINSIGRRKGWFSPANMLIVLVVVLIFTWLLYAVAGPLGFLLLIALIAYFAYAIFLT